MKSKLFSMMILTFVLVMGHSDISYAAKDYYTFNDHTMNGGIGNEGLKYYYFTHNAKAFEKNIRGAMDDWVYTTQRINYTTPLSFKMTGERKYSSIDVIVVDSAVGHGSNTIAFTEYYKKGGDPVNQEKKNWQYCYVKLVKNKLKVTDGRDTIAHEFGHCFGLAHNNSNPKSIMCQKIKGRLVTKPQKGDLKGINYLYK